MMKYKKVTCPLKYFEVEQTEEFNKSIEEGWKVKTVQYNQATLTVTFLMEKDEP